MKNYNDILISSLNNTFYYTNEDLRINIKNGFMLSRKELDEYLSYKDSCKNKSKVELPLKTFNSKNIYYFKSNELLAYLNDYLDFLQNDLKEKNSTIVSENFNDIILSRMTSELDGTLRIEGVNTTRKKILAIVESKNVANLEEQIISNMYNGYKFILSKPKFNKENLLKLYKVLSYKSLNEEDEIKDYYRTDMVEIGDHDGCPVDKITECMDSLFKFVNSNISKKFSSDMFFLPFIVHYYILYIHPYMDFNGRTARMASLWISFLIESEKNLPTYISEAINDHKNNYYKAIDNTRYSHNDLTYFLTYLIKIANEYYLVYKNISSIKDDLALIGESITATEIYYLKRIII